MNQSLSPIEGQVAITPGVRYVTTPDGVRIAFWTLGEGLPLVYLTGGPWSHVELWDVPACRQWNQRLAQSRRLVRYDVRGTGLSQRAVADHSLNALLLDLTAVVDGLGLERFALFGAADAGPLVVAYAARYPDRVAHLVLWCTWARSADLRLTRSPVWLGLLDQDWDLLPDTCAHLALGWPMGDIGRAAARRLIESVTPEVARAALAAVSQFDVTDLLPRLRMPTLVLHRRDIPWLPVGIARALASPIPDARLIVLEGESLAPFVGAAEPVASAIDEFLHEGAGQAAPLAALGAARDHEDAHLTDPIETRLTARERQVLRLLATGSTNAEIANELCLSTRTIERHVANSYAKIGARGRADATAYALRCGLV